MSTLQDQLQSERAPHRFNMAEKEKELAFVLKELAEARLELARHARDGGLLSYGVGPGDIFRRAASYVDRILRGEKPGDLPVQFPTKFEMVLNRKTAKALGLAVPPSILLRADEVIE